MPYSFIFLSLFFGLFGHSYFVEAATPRLEFLDQLAAKGVSLNHETSAWMKRWRTLDLEQEQLYTFGKFSGSTSINVKVQKFDSSASDGFRSQGTFVPRNSSGNPNTEIAYFNLSVLFGIDHLIRPAVRYELGPHAKSALQRLLLAAKIDHPAKRKNRSRILEALAASGPLQGCLKAKKPDSAVALEDVSRIRSRIQASASQPTRGKLVNLRSNYLGDEFELARELSILMTFDAVFGQWDRFSGGNIGIRLDQQGQAHFYFTDNGGASLSSSTSRVEQTLRWFSRYDRQIITKLRTLHSFLSNEIPSYQGYHNPEAFIVDLGLYFESSPERYVERVKRNIALVLKKVEETERNNGADAYFE